MCDITNLHGRHDSFICVTRLIHPWDMNHSYMCHDSSISVCVTLPFWQTPQTKKKEVTCATWLIHKCVMTYHYVYVLPFFWTGAKDGSEGAACSFSQDRAVYISIYIYLCILYRRARTHTYACTHTRTHARTRARTHAHAHTCTHTHTHAHTYAHTRTHTHTHTHAHTHARARTHTNTHT